MYTLRQISPDDSVSGLSLGDEAFVPLKTFLTRYAKAYHRKNAARTYVIVADAAPKKVVAYVTLVCSQIHVDSVPEDAGEYGYKDYPAVKIARLAVDKRHRERGLGRKLVDWAIAVAIERIMPHVGCMFVVLDAKQQSIKFYEKHGFRKVDTPENNRLEHPVMFLDIGRLA